MHWIWESEVDDTHPWDVTINEILYQNQYQLYNHDRLSMKPCRPKRRHNRASIASVTYARSSVRAAGLLSESSQRSITGTESKDD